MSTRGTSVTAPKNARSLLPVIEKTPSPTVPTGGRPPNRAGPPTLVVPNAGSTAPAKQIITPRSRAWGLAATARASRRLPGPSAFGSSADRAAPVTTTGAAPP